MKKKFTIYLICLTLTMNLFGQFGGGSGTEGDPYIISTAAHLDAVRNHLNNAEIWFLQTDDISLSSYQTDEGWEPIGGNGTDDRFTSHFNGDGFKITGLVINRPGVANVGLFGHIGVSDNKTATTIKNLGIESVDITGGRGTGTLTGRVTGNQNTVIENCCATGTLEGDGANGGLVGSNNSHKQNSAAAESFRPSINKCWANVEVSLRTAESSGKDKFGGLTGCNQKGMISNCYARGSVTVADGEAYDETLSWEKITTTGPGENETYVTATGINSFSRWTIGSADTPMPISLLSFDATAQNNQVILRWKTASEINNNFFTIERSTNGKDFHPLKKIYGAGTTHEENQYQAKDTNPVKGISYYRLRQTDFDGTTEVFKPVSVAIHDLYSNDITFYPNPNNGIFTISWNGEKDLAFRIIDITGRVVYENSVGSINTFDASFLKPGMYSIIFLTEKKVVKKLVVKK